MNDTYWTIDEIFIDDEDFYLDDDEDFYLDDEDNNALVPNKPYPKKPTMGDTVELEEELICC